MITCKVKAEIRTDFHDETISLNARSVNGVMMPAKSWRKRYYHAEVDGVPCMIRAREEVSIPENLKKGQTVIVGFSKLDVDSDVSQIWASSLELVK